FRLEAPGMGTGREKVEIVSGSRPSHASTGKTREERPMLGRIRALLILLSLILPGCGGTKPAGAPGDEVMTLEGALGNRYVPAGAESPVVARLRIGTRAPTALMQGPINVALVIDTSGSMEGAPIEDARAASLAMMDSLSNHDKLAVI